MKRRASRMFLARPLLWILMAAFPSTPAKAVDLETFEFSETNGTELFQTLNSANPGNSWFTTNFGVDVLPSMVENGSYVVYKDTNAFVSSYLQTDNFSSGKVYMVADMSSWALRDFVTGEPEEVRLAFINEDTGDAGNTITAQMEFARTTGGGFELNGSALGLGSSNIADTLPLNLDQLNSFTAVLELNKNSNNYKVFYKDGTNPSQVLGAGQVAPSRAGNSVRFVMNNNWGSDFETTREEHFGIDRFVVADANPLTDLLSVEINRDDASLTLINSTGEVLSNLERISITSAAGALDATGWKPITGNYDVDGDLSVDFDDPWSIDVSSTAELSESVQSGNGGVLSVGQQVVLSQGGGVWIKSPYEDIQVALEFSGGVTRTANVDFVGNGGQPLRLADLNFDNALTADDWLLFVPFMESDLSGLSLAQAYQRGDFDGDGVNSILDFGIFKDEFTVLNGPGSFEQMLASIPEPHSAVLMMFAVLAAVVMRRDHRHVFLLMVGMVTLIAPAATAGVLEDFPFNEANGTILAGAANTANPGNFWIEDADMTNSSVQNGVYRVQKDNLNFGSNGLDIVDVTAGTVWMVAEFGGWAFTSDVIGGDEEEIRFTFLNNTSPDPPGSTITAQMELERIDTGGGTGRLEINGQALGAGGTNISPVTLNLVQNDPFTMVLELNKTINQYSIFYKDGANDFVPLGNGNVEPTRNGNTVRMVFNNDFSDGVGEFVDLDRFYITDEDPLGQIELLGINVHETTGEITIANGTGSSFDIDYYRISSAAGALNFNLWNSLDDQDFEAIGTGVGESWDEAGGANDNVLAEAYLLSSSQFDPNDTVSIGNVFRAGSFMQGNTDLVFEYRDAATGNVFTGDLNFISGGVDGDFNTDGSWNCSDVDALVVEIVNSTNDPSFDMNGDGSVNEADLQQWLIVGGVNNPADTGGNALLPGDATLDGTVDGADFLVWNNNKFTSVLSWCGGDFNADGSVDGQDFLIWNNNKFQSSDFAAPAVPEPSGAWSILMALFTLFAGQRSGGPGK